MAVVSSIAFRKSANFEKYKIGTIQLLLLNKLITSDTREVL